MLVRVEWLSRSQRVGQAALSGMGCIILLSLLIFLPAPFCFIAPVAVALGPIVTILCFQHPFLLCLAFILFSFFRIHEAFPVLLPLRIPSMLAIPTLGALFWHVCLTRKIQSYWPLEIKVFLVFFGLTTAGVLFALHIPTAFSYWAATYWKIAVMCLAIAWLVQTPRDFQLLARALIAAGCLIGWVAITNKLAGIGLVEETRVTIGREYDSVLGDPNDLSLVLLFPLSFAVALIVKRTGWLNRLIGVLGTGTIIYAIICTQSRGGLLGILTVFGLIGWRSAKSKVVLGSIMAVAALGLFLAMGISKRASGGAHEDGIDESAMGRIHAWNAAWRMAVRRPFTGVGVNNFTDNYWAYSDHWDGKNHAVHSTWLNVLSETGFPGFFAFVWMIGCSFLSNIRSSRIIKRARPPPVVESMSVALLAGLLSFCVSGTFLTQGFTWPIYILLALTVALERFLKKSEGMVKARSD